ncbi:osmoprotectant transport system substrate-binding protein [Raineyella antarctica]|uniref:Osmoprotectant transport system substrate-binding protein n=1 Tax=Raineyella antarctica TaxID=1577474 RepID=A0A1G6GG59_9ACTN|nr:ABC transporter substrate-binding protein [Raineyella antarctica]SDB80813.1 osmoprotectant transport system substrate-binding protein [Raineyella antarctica]
MTRRPVRLLAAGAAMLLALAGCATSNPTAGSSPAAGSSAAAGTIKVGSANFPESEIIAEAYAQALEAKGVTVERHMQIGARDIYIAALKDGSVDLVPEYTGNLLQYLDPKTTAKTPEEVNAALAKASPQGFTTLTPAPAEDKDSYNVTKQFSDQNGITSLADLSKFQGQLKVGGNPELAQRPYGPKGLTDVYGVPAGKITFTAISDAGGPLTVKALKDGSVDMADIYSTTPAITDNGFVTLSDPKNMIMSQNVVPMISDKVASADVKKTLDSVSAALTTNDLLAMNARNQGSEKASPAKIAGDWLKEKKLV